MNNSKLDPPPLITKFLSWFCPDHLYEEIEGDLTQKFQRDVKVFGERKAKRRYVWNTIRFLRPGIILRNKLPHPSNTNNMIFNYFKIALRVMLRNKTFTGINVAGLSMGISGAIVLFLWIENDFSYDQFHADKDRIYMAWNKTLADGHWQTWSSTPRVLAPTLAAEYAAVDRVCSFAEYTESYLFTAGNTKIMKNAVVFSDPAFFSIFSFPLLKGDSAHALDNPKSIVLTEKFAKQLFGPKEAYGETVTIGYGGESFPITVSGILKDLPANTDFDFSFIIPWQFLESVYGQENNWYNNSVLTFIKLKDGADLPRFNQELKDIRKKFVGPKDYTEIFLHPLADLHLYSRFENGVVAGGRIEVLRMLGILGVCLIAVACINFINLSTARSQKRSKEVAVRKVTGAYRSSLVLQFLCESLLIALGAGLVSLFIVYFSLPLFNNLIGKSLHLDFHQLTFWGIALTFIFTVGILAGGYPAFYLSSLRPVNILKGGSGGRSGGNFLRTALVVVQFGLAVTLIFSTIVIREQIRFVQTRDTGYNKDNLVYQYITGDLGKNYLSYKQELLQSGIAVSLARTSTPITKRLSNSQGVWWRGKDPGNKTVIERFGADEHISTTAGLTIVRGRDLDLSQFLTDSTGMLLNESAVKLMGFSEPIGEVIQDNGIDWHVVGVVKDFILTSPYQKVEPMIIPGARSPLEVIHIRLNPERPVPDNLGRLSDVFAKYNPDYPFDFEFVDIEYERKFSSMQDALTITTIFSSLAIFISCLGLLGLSTYMIESRVKEIGIRKTLGSTVYGIVKLLSVKSLKPVLISILVFSPLGWLAMNWWLQSYAYRIRPSLLGLVTAGAVIVAIALLTIIVQTVLAARVNPVESLRNE